jgi:hypothetical protein
MSETLGDSFEAAWPHLTDVELCQTVIHGGWLIIETDWGTRHIVPAGDHVLHRVEPDDECVCVPAIETLEHPDYAFLATHSSLDGRETHETP